MRKLLRRSKGKDVYYECSSCEWYFKFSVQVDAPSGQTEEELKNIHEAQRDEAFEVHNCSDFPRAKGRSSKTR